MLHKFLILCFKVLLDISSFSFHPLITNLMIINLNISAMVVQLVQGTHRRVVQRHFSCTHCHLVSSHHHSPRHHHFYQHHHFLFIFATAASIRSTTISITSTTTIISTNTTISTITIPIHYPMPSTVGQPPGLVLLKTYLIHL